jgi:hypothetical protein
MYQAAFFHPQQVLQSRCHSRPGKCDPHVSHRRMTRADLGAVFALGPFIGRTVRVRRAAQLGSARAALKLCLDEFKACQGDPLTLAAREQCRFAFFDMGWPAP